MENDTWFNCSTGLVFYSFDIWNLLQDLSKSRLKISIFWNCIMWKQGTSLPTIMCAEFLRNTKYFANAILETRIKKTARRSGKKCGADSRCKPPVENGRCRCLHVGCAHNQPASFNLPPVYFSPTRRPWSVHFSLDCTIKINRQSVKTKRLEASWGSGERCNGLVPYAVEF